MFVTLEDGRQINMDKVTQILPPTPLSGEMPVDELPEYGRYPTTIEAERQARRDTSAKILKWRNDLYYTIEFDNGSSITSKKDPLAWAGEVL